jgi:type VI secretion system protein ImpA
MPLLEDLLNPIAGDNPSGQDVRYDNKLLVYDKIKEARRQDDNLAQGAWEHERKVADYALVGKLAQEALGTRTKDLQLAAWLTEAALRTEGFSGLRQGLVLCHGLVDRFWDTLYPPLEDGNSELRAAPLEWLGSALEIPLKNAPLVRSGYDWFKLKESRVVGYEDQAKTEKDKKARAKMLAEGKLAPEAFDKAFVETPKAFYLQAEKDLDSCLEAQNSLDELCSARFGESAPSLGKLKIAVEEVRHAVHILLEKKRETEPDPVENTPAAAATGETGAPAASDGSVASTGAPVIVISVMTSSEPADRREVIASVARAAAFLRQREPHSPAPYLMMRGLRWGELRAAAKLADATLLEAPPTELRQQVKRLALAQKWSELLETAENAMSLPCSRAWLDLQRLVVEACTALGGEYESVAASIGSELLSLLNDVPQLLDASLLDDTPAANSETKAWLKQLSQRPAKASAPGQGDGENSASASAAQSPALSWPARATDSYALAQEFLKAGQPEKAFEIMQKEIADQRSGRGRFERKLQLVELCVAAGKDAIAQPLLDDLAAAIDNHRLEDWEDKEMVAAALTTVMTLSKKVQGNAAEKQKLFERICRLDAVRALRAG